MSKKIKDIKTTDTYKAAFYMMWGGVVYNISRHNHTTKQASKLHRPATFTFYIEGVPQWAIDTYKTKKVYGCISDFIRARKRLKRKLHKHAKKT